MFLKKLICKHDYHLISNYKKDMDASVGYKLEEIFVVYCPKCKKEEELLEHQYKAVINKQKIDKEYNDK